MKKFLMAALLAASPVALHAQGTMQPQVTLGPTSALLSLSAEGQSQRAPDIALFSAGVVTQAKTASEAMADNSRRMDQVVTALKRAGVADRDIQTSAISLNPEYRYPENQSPQLSGYTASNQVTVRFRDIRNSGKVLDILVAEGANQISGPNMTIEHPEEALDEARARAVAAGRARASLYARALGMRVARVISVSDGGGYYAPPPPPPAPVMMAAERSYTKIEPGEQKLQVSLSMVFELQ